MLKTCVHLASLFALMFLLVTAPLTPVKATPIGIQSAPAAPQTANPAAWHNVFPDYSRVRMLNPSFGWAVGQDGVIRGYDGVRWRDYPSPTTADLASVYPVSMDEAWAVGGNLILHYQSNSWTLLANPPANSCLQDVWMLSANDGWAVGGTCTNSNAVILHYTGGVWQPASVPSGTLRLDALQMVSATEGWAVGYRGSIVHYTGGSWVPIPSPVGQEELLSIAMLPDGSEGWAGRAAIDGDSYTIHYQNGAWTTATLGPPTPAAHPGPNHPPRCYGCASIGYGVAALSPTVRMVVGPMTEREKYLTFYYGTGLGLNNQWNYHNEIDPYTLTSVSMLSPTDAWVVGENGYIGHYDGTTITRVDGITTTVNALAYNQTRHELYVRGDNPYEIQVINTITHQETFSCTTTPGLYHLTSLEGSSRNVWAVGSGGYILHITDSGCDLTQVGLNDLYGVAFASPNLGIAVGGGEWSASNLRWHMA